MSYKVKKKIHHIKPLKEFDLVKKTIKVNEVKNSISAQNIRLSPRSAR